MSSSGDCLSIHAAPMYHLSSHNYSLKDNATIDESTPALLSVKDDSKIDKSTPLSSYRDYLSSCVTPVPYFSSLTD